MSKSNGGKSKSCCISHKFVDADSKNPHKIAVIQASGLSARRIRSESAEPSYSPPVYDGDKCFTFAEISSSIDSLTSRLRRILSDDDSREAGSDVYMPKVLALYMPPSVEYIVSVFSVLRCGEAFLPFDPSWPRGRVLSLIASSNVSLVIACGSSSEGSHWLVESNAFPALLFSMDEKLNVETGCSSFVWPCKKEKQINFCYLMYTSGSTGKPKGVCGTEQGL